MNNYSFEKLEEGLYRLCLPFDTVYTSVFAFVSESGTIILDTATTEKDVIDIIVPAINEAGFKPDYILVSHHHADHSGGLEFMLKAFPQATAGMIKHPQTYDNGKSHYLTDGEVILNDFEILNLKGHSDDCIAVLDRRTKTLVTCDCFQQYGVDKYRCYAPDVDGYLNSIQRVKNLPIDRMICSHDYEPLGFSFVGRDEIIKCLDLCESTVINN